MTPPASEGSRIATGIPLMPSLSVASMAYRLITSSTPAGSLSLCVQHLAVGVRTRSRCTNVVLLYKEHRL
jgi:hypothetical protein